MWFRVLIALLSTLAWVVTLWMGTHISSTPEWFDRWSTSYGLLLLGLAGSALLLTGVLFPRVYARAQRYRVQIVALMGSLLVSALTVEAAIRGFDVLGISYYAESTRYHLDKLPDTELYYKHRSNYIANYQGVSCSFNELGLRDDQVSDPGPSELRVLFVGDSVTFGWGVAQENTFVELTAQTLESRLARPVSAINGGCGSYNSEQELSFVRRFLPTLAPNVVILTYVSNDAGSISGKFDPWGRTSLVGKSPPEIVQLLAWRSWTYRLASHTARYALAPSRSAQVARGPDWDVSFRAIGEIARACREGGAKFVVFLWRLDRDALTDSILDRLEESSRSESFLVADFGAVFQGLPRRELINSPVDSHPNEWAHQLAAEYIARTLVEGDLVSRGGMR